MKNYVRGKIVKEELELTPEMFGELPKNCVWMKVMGGSKMKSLLRAATSKFAGTIVWSGAGDGMQKAISCAEIMKRKYSLAQKNVLCYQRYEEHWDPVLEGLDPLVVNRDVPAIHILMERKKEDYLEPALGLVNEPQKRPRQVKRRSAHQLKESTPKK